MKPSPTRPVADYSHFDLRGLFRIVTMVTIALVAVVCIAMTLAVGDASALVVFVPLVVVSGAPVFLLGRKAALSSERGVWVSDQGIELSVPFFVQRFDWAGIGAPTRRRLLGIFPSAMLPIVDSGEQRHIPLYLFGDQTDDFIAAVDKARPRG